MAGKIYVVGLGPGNKDNMTFKAFDVLNKVDVIAGYTTYVNLIKDLFKDKEYLISGMKKEVARCEEVIEVAKSGRDIALISSGDPGIYGMAGILLELAKGIEVEVIPGVSAFNASASLLGAPIMHDSACISLSDLLTPWNLILDRVELCSKADMVISLYNPKSKGRPHHIDEAREKMLLHKKGTTPVGIVKNAMRDNQTIVITDLENMLNHEIDMLTTVIIGNSQTFAKDGKIITPRGYRY